MPTPTKSVCFIGPQSTGKTTLSNALQEKFGSNVFLLKEVARTVLKTFDCNTDHIFSDSEKCYDLQKRILFAQCRSEFQLAEQHTIYISDRSAIDPIVYAKFHLKPEAHQSLCELDIWKNMKLVYQNQSEMLLVLIEPNEMFLKSDGTRKMPQDLKEWSLLHECFVSFLSEHNIPCKVIPGNVTSIEQRTAMVMDWILKL